MDLKTNRTTKQIYVRLLGDVRIQNSASVLLPSAAARLCRRRYCPRLEEVLPHELSATSGLQRLMTVSPFALSEPILPNGFSAADAATFS